MMFTLTLLLMSPQAHASSAHTDAPMSAAATAVFSAWRVKAAPCFARLAAIPADASVAVSLAERVEADQCLRRSLDDPDLAALPAADQDGAQRRMWGEIGRVDLINTNYLKSVLPADGWFRASRDGRKTARDAWLIVQHSPDQAFQRRVVALMEPLAKAGEVEGRDYALLYDRTEMFAGRPQYYGSQYQCEKGRWSAYRMRDAAGVEARRKAFGMDTMAENLVKMSADGGC